MQTLPENACLSCENIPVNTKKSQSYSLGTALALAYVSNLFGGLTHYGFGSAPIFFGAGFVDLRKWWSVGFYVSLLNLIIWLGVGSLWWSLLGDIV